MSESNASRNDLVLSVNAGSSSLKISLYQALKYEIPSSNHEEPVKLLLTSSISNISAPPAKFSFKLLSDADTTTTSNNDNNKNVKDQLIDSIKDHASAFAHFVHHLVNATGINQNRIAHICHRVVHGGDYHEPIVISDETYHHIENLSDLAPLHNGAALAVIKSCISDLPNANSIAFFDTAFHRSIPSHIASYAIDQTIAKKRGLKKYGFHGLSYAFILRSVAKFFQRPADSLNLIVLHLGSGASACAIRDGKSLDTSMGLTPLNGLPGATRSGAIDPSLIFHYTNKAGRITHDPNMAINLHVTQAEQILNSKSGWKSLTGTTDFAVISQRALEGSEMYRTAFDLFVDRILNYIGSYHLKLDAQVDALVFSGGIGEKSRELRKAVGQKLKCIGYNNLDDEKNTRVDDVEGSVVEIDVRTNNESEKRILVCRTDEQFEMARQCALEDKFW
ncbi:hypothetical protein K435DRAFT_837523 [Dendrothele bispora CBS 962.96]|uniref:Probable acetate kinase n=1 Tax=Dendrothele bispora (strain CBS 962.96) TaxID=1314807 RepID=A0A4S8MBV0_DENBC|nr:hypothetical protein K435DRAFT_837523 [Dendrothele bispora CBS 962.96]